MVVEHDPGEAAQLQQTGLIDPADVAHSQAETGQANAHRLQVVHAAQYLEVLDRQHLRVGGYHARKARVLLGDGLARHAEGRALKQLIKEQGVGDEEQDTDRNDPEAVLPRLIAQYQIQQAGGEVAAHLDAERAANGEREPRHQGVSQKQPGGGKGEQKFDGLSDPHQRRGERQSK